MMPPKTVYVLGAGFSRAAGLPLQAEILGRIRDFRVGALLTAPLHSTDFSDLRRRLEGFLAAVFPTDAAPSLEDLFTLLDHAIAHRSHCVGFDWKELEEIREALNRTVLFVLHAAVDAVPRQKQVFYRSLAADLLARRLGTGPHATSPVTVISLNWDTLIEDAIYWCIREAGGLGRSDIDYGCDTQPLDTSTPHVSSVTQVARGIANVRVLKLHGSTNWLVCPNCEQLYTGVGSAGAGWAQYMVVQPCPGCARRRLLTSTGAATPTLQPFFITPTFLKLFDNAHIQLTWQRAALEFAEATEVVFIGYSLPQADYHFRTLLRRALRPEASIVAVLVESDDAHLRTPLALRGRGLFAADRYREFFGPGVTLDLRGLRRYFGPRLRRTSLPRKLTLLRRRLRRWASPV